MNRREFLKYCTCLTGTVTSRSVLGTNLTLERKADLIQFGKRLPNIVLILADDLGYGDLSCQNPESKIPTPNLDRLAYQGIRFTDAHSPSSVCTPTRYSILTGRYCWRTRLKREVLRPWSEPLIQQDRLTIAKLLSQNGYTTACIGKWHLGFKWPTTDNKSLNPTNSITDYETMPLTLDLKRRITDGPLNHGFDYFFGVDAPNFPPYCYIENDRTVGIPTIPKPKEMFGLDGPMVEGWDLYRILPDLTERAVAYIDKKAKSGTPFFLYFPMTAPHTPIVPTSGFKGKSHAGHYGDFVCQLDHSVGQIIDALKHHDIENNTLIIVTSDNGSPARDGSHTCGEIGSVRRYGHDPSWIFKGMKADIWDGGHRIPFIAKWPGKIQPDTTSDELICLTDLVATIAAIVGQALPEDAGEDSYNILPALLGQKCSKPIREAIVHHAYDGMFSIRQGPWKLILDRGSGGFTEPRRIVPSSGEPTGQLYNMQEDISETINLYSERRDIVARLSRYLDDYIRLGRSTPILIKN